MARVHFERASCTYPGASRPAVDRLELAVQDGELLVLVGPSGSGKSTVLRMLAGLEPVSAGRVLVDGVDVSAQPPGERDVAMVFQNYALYPHMSVAQNMGFALRLARVPAAERERRVREAARLLDLEALLERKPRALSGGQRQRVAMGRAIVREPRVFLMDEPLSNLDAKLRVQTRTELASLQARLGVTTLYVTHDQVEAMTMGRRVAVLEGGVLQQCDTPRALYARPANVFVAGFIGSPAMNLHSVPLGERGALLGGASVALEPEALAQARREGLGEVTLGVRPEAFTPAQEGFPFQVEAVEELGADAFLHGRTGAAALVVRVDGRAPPRRGELLRLQVRPGEAHAFHPRAGERLGLGGP